MIICPNCQKELPDGANFCDGCGTQFQQAVICPACGNQTAAGQPSCQVCGAQFAPAEKKSFNLDAIKNLPKKTLGLIGGAIVALVAIIIVVAIVAGSGMPNYALYYKGTDLYYRDLSKKTGVELEDATSAVLSSDGKTLFIVDEDGDLVYRNITKKNAEEKKWISMSDVDDIAISENGKIVTYLKNDGTLYQKKLGADAPTKIASDVNGFTVTPNGSKILYVTDESDVYYVSKVKENNKGVKVASGVDKYGIEYISEDLKTIVYTKEDTLYTVKAGKEPVKVASEIDNVYAYGPKSIYYVTAEKIEEGDDAGKILKSLFYYDGKKSTALAEDNFAGIESGNKKAEALVFYTEEEKSDDETAYEVNLALGTNVSTIHEYTVKYGDDGREDFDYASDIRFTKDGKKLYYIIKTESSKPSEDGKPVTGDLIERKVAKKLGDAKTIDTDVYSLDSATVTLGKPVYTKDYKTPAADAVDSKATYDVYKAGKLVYADVESFSYSEIAKGFIIKSGGSLIFYKSKPVTISDDFDDKCQYVVLPTGDILFTKDINEKSGKGDLYRFTGSKKSKLVDTDVSRIGYVSYVSATYEDGAHLYLSAPGVPSENNNNEVEIGF